MADEFDKLPALKENDLEKLGPCVVCGKTQLGPHAGVTFYKLQISRAGFDGHALRRRVGLEMVLGGSSVLARAMGPDDALARVFDGPHDVFVHEICAGKIMHILELVPKEKPESEVA